MTQQVEVFAAKPHSVTSIPGTHRGWREPFPQLSFDFYTRDRHTLNQ